MVLYADVKLHLISLLIGPFVDFKPIQILKIELSDILPAIRATNEAKGIRYGAAQVFACLHDHPLGMVEFPLTEESTAPEEYAPKIWDQLGQTINFHLRMDNLPQIDNLPATGLRRLGSDAPGCKKAILRALNHLPLISVIICTHERPAMLHECLQSVFQLDYPNYEIIVVDNAPKTDATRVVVDRSRKVRSGLKYVLEPNQGQCWARNTGAKIASGKIIAYTDDDVLVDPHWLKGILEGFAAADNVGAVNGLTIPAELESVEQTWFEQSGGFNKGYDPKIFDMGQYKPSRPFYPFSAGIFGTGANLAIRKDTLETIGYFDPALGAGTITACGDDLAIYLQLLFAGYRLVYEPAATVRHIHRRSYSDLQSQLYNYGIGFSAFLTKTLIDHPGRIPGFLLRIPYGLYLLLSPGSFKNTKKTTNYPSNLRKWELYGMFIGGFLYLKSFWKTRKLIRQRALEETSVKQS
jgi:glycosyltransferase involved in cell wall biosynthesis